ncbi:MAG: hypothetical protein QM808_11770 [Steroidobacteraceae bacterium]
MGENYVGSLLLTGAGFNRQICAAAVDAPLLPERLSERIQLSNNAAMKLSNVTLERQVRGVFARSDDSLLQPESQVSNLPGKVMLAYEMTEPLSVVFARQSSAFRTAAKKAGKSVVYQAALQEGDDDSAYHAQLLNEVIGFISGVGSGALAAAP